MLWTVLLGCEVSYRNNGCVVLKVVYVGKHKVIVVPSLLHGYETRTLRADEIRGGEAAEMKILRRVVGYILLNWRRNKIRNKTEYVKQLRSAEQAGEIPCLRMADSSSAGTPCS
jgi:hypothetical protein